MLSRPDSALEPLDTPHWGMSSFLHALTSVHEKRAVHAEKSRTCVGVMHNALQVVALRGPVRPPAGIDTAAASARGTSCCCHVPYVVGPELLHREQRLRHHQAAGGVEHGRAAGRAPAQRALQAGRQLEILLREPGRRSVVVWTRQGRAAARMAGRHTVICRPHLFSWLESAGMGHALQTQTAAQDLD